MSNTFGTVRYGGGGRGGNQWAAHPAGDLTSQIVNTVKQDMDSVEKSGQWIFSCYSPAKDCVSVPGMDDVSPEELRLEAYVAKSSGSIDQYTNRVKTLINEFSNQRNMMKNPDQNLRQTLVQIYNKENILGGSVGGGGVFGSSAQPGSGGGLFGGSTSSSDELFGAPASISSAAIFGGNTQTTGDGGGLFGKTSATSGGLISSNQSSAFVTNSNVGQSVQSGSSLLGGTGTQGSQNSIFGGSGATSTSLFGGSAAQIGGSVFSGTTNQAPSTGGSVFGGRSVFGSTSSQSAFGTPAATGGSIFGSANLSSTSTFGAVCSASPLTTGMFGTASTGSSTPQKPTAFASPQPSGASLFGGSTSTNSTVVDTAHAQPTGQALFGGSGLLGAQSSSGGIFGSSDGDNSQGGSGLFGKSGGGGGLFGKVEKHLDPSCIWTLMDQLTEAEKAAFLAPEFELGNVPTRPPPREWCF